MSRRAESTYHPGRLFAPEFHDPDLVHHAVLKDIFPLPERAPLPFPARTMAGYEVFSARLRRYVDKHHQPRNCCAHCFRCHWRRLRVQRTPYVVPKPLPRCSGCNITYYCDRVCQEEDWSRHKNYCKDTRTTARMPRCLFGLPKSLGRTHSTVYRRSNCGIGSWWMVCAMPTTTSTNWR